MNRLTRLLLASTCLTVVSTAAPAGALTVSEIEPNDNIPGQTLPVGTTQIDALAEIDGQLHFDFFKLTGLDPGRPFSATLTPVTAEFPFESTFDALDSASALITGASLNALTAATVDGTIPADGMVVLRIQMFDGVGEAGNYRINVNAPLAAVPEPTTFGLLASGLAGLAGLRALSRKRD